MNGCPFLVEDCTMDGTDYDCEHPTYGTKYGCDKCPMFGRNGGKRQYRLVNPRERHLTKHAPDVGDSAASSDIFLASEVSALQGESTPAPTQVM
jgi:hypothetical protein